MSTTDQTDWKKMMLNLKKAQELLNAQEDQPKELVLILDDEEPNLRQMEAILQQNYWVLTAPDGKVGLEKLETPGIAVML